MTTAAGIWVVAAIGLLIGSGYWLVGMGGTVLVLLITNLSSLVPRRPDAVSDYG